MIGKILKKYDGQRDYWFPDIENPFEHKYLSEIATLLEKKMFDRWRYCIGDRWYGFSLGELPVPADWFLIIHEFLLYLEKEDPGFKIHQIKTKYGGIRFYIGLSIYDEEKIEFINLQIEKLENTLYDKKLAF